MDGWEGAWRELGARKFRGEVVDAHKRPACFGCRTRCFFPVGVSLPLLPSLSLSLSLSLSR